MSAILRYLAGGAIALASQGFFAVSFGLPSAMSTVQMPQIAQAQDLRPTPVAALQQVDRTLKGDRLVPEFKNAPEPLVTGNEFVSNDTARRLLKPALKLMKPTDQKLPDGCSASISPLSDRVAANQASNCITSLELPWKVASAN